MAMELEVQEYQPPVIRINYDELKAALGQKLKDYKSLVVTEETLPGCKAAKKELTALKTKIDNYRKDTKKEASIPIDKFNEQCNTLIHMIDDALDPIREGIKVFDDKKREAKGEIAKKIIAEVIEEMELNEKYGSQLTLIDRYKNLTITEKEVRQDLEARALTLKTQQDQEKERIDLIVSMVEDENKRLTTKMDSDRFLRMLERGYSLPDVIKEVKANADTIYQAEHKPVEPESKKEETPAEQTAAPVETPVAQEPVKMKDPLSDLPYEDAESDPLYVATYKISGTEAQLMSVSAFLKEHGITYDVPDQRRL